MDVAEIRLLKQLEGENRKLKTLVAALSLSKAMETPRGRRFGAARHTL